jgi:hypothetical protein
VINFKFLSQHFPEVIKGNCEKSQNYLPAGRQSNTLPEGGETGMLTLNSYVEKLKEMSFYVVV